MNKKTLVLGASENPSRYSNMAIQRLRDNGHDVVAIGSRKGKVLDVTFETEQEHFENIDTVTVYLNPKNQETYESYILSLHPKRIVFNPGTENYILAKRAKERGIETLEACTLVLLATGQY